jgi:hypothetical protein
MEPTLFMAHGFENYNEEGRLKAKFEGDYFVVGFEDPVAVAHWPKFVISDLTVWVDVGTLHYLRGKTLTLRNLETPAIDSKILVTA